MEIKYLPNKGFFINSLKIEWNDNRDVVRKLLENKHKSDDQIIDVSHCFNGDESINIHQKRDIYENLYSKNDSLFLSYNKDNVLNELEVHHGFDILVGDIRLKFGKEIMDFVKLFQNKGIEYIETESGNYFLPDLKIVIANNESFGGNGTCLEYFYSAFNTDHLM
ncbi:hypothetical protein [uncultured Kordia sp.]|uniref:hypothetical protein n=1 Tax=uncultured Kordia sp. TaxID=507699 RepID=UPI002605433A|nr:hypothetical protein [uncultured Kordia sp.]